MTDPAELAQDSPDDLENGARDLLVEDVSIDDMCGVS
ncbi:MAG: mycofactocin precursor MftA [Nocardioidaceae bacterium]